MFTKSQSDFLPLASCISQLLSITHKIYKSFDCNPPLDVRGTFLDISKAFDKVLYDGLIFKLQIYGIIDKILNLMQDYLCSLEQRVALNEQTSFWEKVLAGVSQGSVLGLLLFWICTNDIPEGIKSWYQKVSNGDLFFKETKSVQSFTTLMIIQFKQ